MILSYCLLTVKVLSFAGNAEHTAQSLGHEDLGDDFERATILFCVSGNIIFLLFLFFFCIDYHWNLEWYCNYC